MFFLLLMWWIYDSYSYRKVDTKKLCRIKVFDVLNFLHHPDGKITPILRRTPRNAPVYSCLFNQWLHVCQQLFRVFIRRERYSSLFHYII